MPKLLMDYFTDFSSLNNQCKKFISLYFARAYSAGIVFYIAIYLAHINLKASVIGYEISSLVLGNLLGSLVASQVLNNKNAFKLSGYSLIFQGLCFLAISVFNSSYLLALSVFFVGFFGYIYKVASNFLITALSGIDKNSRSKAITYTSVFSNIGIGLGGISVSLFSGNYAAYLFVSTGLLLILSAIPYFRNNCELNEIIQTNTNDGDVYNSRFLLFGFFTILFLGVIFAQQRIGLGLFWEQHFSDYGMSAIILINTIMIISLLPKIRPFLVGSNSIKIMGFGAFLLGAGLFGLRYFSNFYTALLLCMVWTLGEMISMTVSQLICFQFSKNEKRGQAMGIYKFLYAFGTFAGALFGASVLKYYQLENIWIICGALGVGLFIASIVLERIDIQFTRALALRSL